MSVSGLVGRPTGYCLRLPPSGSRELRRRIQAFSQKSLSRTGRFQLEGNCLGRLTSQKLQRRTYLVKCALDASFGDANINQSDIFQRINVKDPYKCLGISNEASEEEIQAARNFLVQRYAWHKPSIDVIEAAHDKIIMQKFHERRRPKLNLKKKVRDVKQHRYVQAVMNRFCTPADTKFIVMTSITFLVLGVLSVLFPTEEGPTLQVAISLAATICFIHTRLKSKLRAFLYGAGAFAFSWILGTFLMVSVVPPLLKGFRAFEVTTSLITYVLLGVASTYLK